MIVIRISALMQFMLKGKKITHYLSTTEKYSFIQASNFINLPSLYDFSKFCFKLVKADADILEKHIRIDFGIDLDTAS